MNNRKLIRAGLLANAVLFVAGGALIYRLTDDRAPTREAAEPFKLRSVPEREVTPPKLPPPEVMQTMEAPPGEAPARVWGRAPLQALTGAPVDGKPAAVQVQVRAWQRREALRAARDELTAGLRELRQRVSACGAADASFVLALEAGDGIVRVGNARLEDRGSASEGAVACAQAALAGHSFPSPSMVPGRRWEVPF